MIGTEGANREGNGEELEQGVSTKRQRALQCSEALNGKSLGEGQVALT